MRDFAIVIQSWSKRLHKICYSDDHQSPVLRKWFAEVKTHLDKENAADLDSTRIFNCDESAFFLSPKGEKVLMKKRDKALYNFIHNDNKECLTVLFTANAAGTLAPPMILFTYERIPASISASIPDSWDIGKIENG